MKSLVDMFRFWTLTQLIETLIETVEKKPFLKKEIPQLFLPFKTSRIHNLTSAHAGEILYPCWGNLQTF